MSVAFVHRLGPVVRFALDTHLEYHAWDKASKLRELGEGNILLVQADELLGFEKITFLLLHQANERLQINNRGNMQSAPQETNLDAFIIDLSKTSFEVNDGFFTICHGLPDKEQRPQNEFS